jgi:hypothetical protein
MTLKAQVKGPRPDNNQKENFAADTLQIQRQPLVDATVCDGARQPSRGCGFDAMVRVL